MADVETKGAPLPDLKKYMEKQVMIRCNGRKISGTLRGFDTFMNVVLQDAVEWPRNNAESTEKISIGKTVIRGNMIVNLEQLQA